MRRTALAQLVELYAECRGVTSTKELAEVTGYTERAIRKAKAELEFRNQGSARNHSSGTRVPKAEPKCRPLARVQAIPKKELNNYNNNTELASSENPTADKNAAVVDLKGLADRLHEAAGNSINRTLGAFEAVTEPLAWIEAGADLEKDVLPAVRSVAAQKRRSQIKSWSYFTDAVIERREKRLGIAAKFKPAPRGQDADLAEADRKLMEAGIDPSLAF